MAEQVAATTATARPKSRKVQKVGCVVSNKADKTIVVVVETLKKHRIYKRRFRQTKRFHAHDENNSCEIGDLVRIEECRPLSKTKRWRLIEIVRRNAGITPVEDVLAEVDPNLVPEETE
jgi:small subunit ribosomal protein S17